MANSFGLESAYQVTRIRASDWSQVQNIMECNRRCHWGSPTIAERLPIEESYARWKHIPMCPLFRNIPSVSYIANVTGNDARLATCIPSNWYFFFVFFFLGLLIFGLTIKISKTELN